MNYVHKTYSLDIFLFQIFYESLRDIKQGEELLLGSKEPILLQGSGRAAPTRGTSDESEGKFSQ